MLSFVTAYEMRYPSIQGDGIENKDFLEKFCKRHKGVPPVQLQYSKDSLVQHRLPCSTLSENTIIHQ